MRVLGAALALGGIPWAYFAFLALFISAFSAPLAALGYVVWLGWFYLAIRGKTLLRPKTFWILSAIVHAGWILFFLLGPLKGPRSEWRSGLITYMWLWLIGNFALGVILGVLETLEEKNA